MTFLTLAIVAAAINHLLFKEFARSRTDLLTAIVANYAVCVVIGLGSSYKAIFQTSFFLQEWFPVSILHGGLFTTCFFLIGRTTEKQGVAVASLSTRLSVAIPAAAAFMLYGDTITLLKITGILIALVALYMSCTNSTGLKEPLKTGSLLPLLLFGAFGLHSTLIKFVQERFLGNTSYHVYVMFAFLSAFVISGSILTYRLIKKHQILRWKDLISGIALGFANYASVYFLIRVLGVPGWQSSQLFPTISIAIVGLSTLGAWIFFKEHLKRRMLAALVIGVVSIILINL